MSSLELTYAVGMTANGKMSYSWSSNQGYANFLR